MILSRDKIKNKIFQSPRVITALKPQKKIRKKFDVYNNRMCDELVYFTLIFMRNLNNRDAWNKHPESAHLWCCYISLVCLVELLLELFLALDSFLLALQVLLFLVTVVEGIVHVFVIVDPSADHMRVLLMEMYARGLSMKENWLIVANLVSSQSSRSIE